MIAAGLFWWGAWTSMAATVSGFSPASGPPGTEVTVTGTGLQTAIAVYFGDTTAPGEIVSAAAGSVRVRVPANAVTGQISVFTSGSGAATSFQIFVAAPRIRLFEPATGGPGTEVTISGDNFSAGQAGGRGNITGVLFNGQAASFQLTSLSQLIAVVPPNATTGPITLVNEAGSASTVVSFQVPGSISGFTPPSGMPGEAIEIRGRNIGNAIRVDFGVVPAAFVSVSPSNLVAVVPTNAVNGRIQVTTPAGIALTTSNFVVRPRIVSFTPTLGRSGTNVTLEGGGLNGVTDVQFNGIKATFSGQSSTRVTTVVPNGATTGPIKVVTTNGMFTTAENFFLPARITSFNPGAGVRGDTVTVDGQNLAGVTRFLFNGVEAPFTLVSPTRLTTQVPALATTGRLTVESPVGAESSSGTFTVRPLLDGFNPISGPVGTAVHLLGSGLTNLSWVLLGDLETTFTVVNSTNVRVIVPLGAYSGTFLLRTAGGTEVESAGTFFVDGARPVLSSFNPPNGNPGTRVTLQGQGLRSATRVEFNGVSATFAVQSGDQLEATVPQGATTGPIAVTTLDGIAISTNAFVIGTQEIALHIERAPGVLRLSWPATSTAFSLEGTARLGPAAAWEAVPGSPVLENGTYRLTIPLPSTGTRYYRLRG